MVSFTKLFLAGAFLIGSTAALPAPGSDSKTLSTTSIEDNTSVTELDARLNKRVPTGVQLLQWAPDGSLLYLIGDSGLTYAVEIMKMIVNHGDGGPGGLLIDMFSDYLISQPNLGAAFDLFELEPINGNAFVRAVFGVHSKLTGKTVKGLWGFAMSFTDGHTPSAADLASLVAVIERFARQDGGQILTQQRANGFIPEKVRTGNAPATKRSRVATCPAKIDLLSFMRADIPTDLDYGEVLRSAEHCVGS